MDTASDTDTPRKGKWRAVVMILAGLVLMAIGGMSVFQGEYVNNGLVKAGAEQSASGIIEMSPEYTGVLSGAANVLEAAVKARTASPEELATMLEAEMREYTGVSMPVKTVVEAVMEQVNAAYKASDTEEKYLEKLLLVAEGIREAVGKAEVAG